MLERRQKTEPPTTSYKKSRQSAFAPIGRSHTVSYVMEEEEEGESE